MPAIHTPECPHEVEWHFLFGEDGFVGALRHAGAAVDAGIGVDVEPGPLLFRVAQDHAFDRTYFDAGCVAKAQSGNDMGHLLSP